MTQEEIDYRQALRDITDPAVTPDPENPTWPTPPASAVGRYGPNDIVLNRPQPFRVPCGNEIV